MLNYQGKLVVIPPDTETFQLNLDLLDAQINERTKALIINNPNNPTGVVYSAETLDRLQAVLAAAEARIGHSIYVISDEPYRELVYDGVELPFMTKHIRNCIIGYSFSKSLSLPGSGSDTWPYRRLWMIMPDLFRGWLLPTGFSALSMRRRCSS